MAGVAEADLYTLAQLEDLSVLLGIEELEGLLRVCQGVEGLYLLPAGPLSLLVLPLGIALLNMSGVSEHDGQQLGGEPGGIDGPGKALLDQQRNAAGVVDMGVGDQNIVDVAGGKIQGVVIVLVPALLETAVDQDLPAVDFQTVAAAGDRVGRAKKRKLHVTVPPSVPILVFIVHGPGKKIHRKL